MQIVTIIFAIIGVIALFCFSCFLYIYSKNVVRGNGNMQTKSFSLNNFDSIDFGGTWKVDIKQGSDFLVEVEADENLFEYFDVYVSGNTLNIRTKRKNISSTKCVAHVTMPLLKRLEGGGVTKGSIKDFDMPYDKMVLALSGASNIEAENISLKDLEVSICGAGNVKVQGKGANMQLEVSGAGKVMARDFETENAELNSSGTSHLEVWAKESLRVNISGASSVRYKGSPNISKVISGASSLKPF